jgi:GntR family transcriptional regulator
MFYGNQNMSLRLDSRDSSPIYLQIAAAVRRAIAAGEIASGDRLPPARALADSLGVNMHTVLRGLAELEREGLVSMRRGRGITVTADAPSRAHLHELLRHAAVEAHRIGIAPADLAVLLKQQIDGVAGRSSRKLGQSSQHVGGPPVGQPAGRAGQSEGDDLHGR